MNSLTHWTIVISIVTIILNLGIFFFSLYLFEKRRKNERVYQIEFKLYENLVLENIPALLEFVSELTTNFHSTLNDCTRQKKKDSIDKIDELFKQLESKCFYAIHCYSLDLRNKVGKRCEEFYDNCTKLLSEISEEKKKDSLETFSLTKKRYLRIMIDDIRAHQPEFK